METHHGAYSLSAKTPSPASIARKKRLLNAARDLFFTRGYEKTTMLDVAKHAGFSKRTVYLDFESKDDLFGAICEEGLQILFDSFKRVMSMNCSAEEKLAFFANAYHAFFVEHNRYFHALFVLATDEILQNMSTAQFGRIQTLEKNCIGLISESIAFGKTQGIIAEHQDPNALAVIVWGALNGVLTLSLNGHRIEMADTDVNDMYWRAFQLVLRGAQSPL